MAVDVGREAELLVEGFRQIGYAVEERAPSGKKWDAKMLRMITGIKRRSNEHERDAIRFVWQR